MSDPENAGAAVISSNDVDISLLTTEDWLELTVFFNTAVFDNPSTEKRMRLKLGMQDEDEFRAEFAETVATFATLAEIGHDFNDDVVEESLSLADDIVHYNTSVQAVYPRFSKLVDYYDLEFDEEADTQTKLDALVKLWSGENVDGMPGKIRDRFKSMLENLIKDAQARATRAEALHVKIMGDGTGPTENDGLLNRMRAVQTAFGDRAQDFANKFGAKGPEIIALEAEKATIEAELKSLRKKDKDETIVLSTSPLYLAIPLAGPFIMAGVLIGVGVDMANVRAKIESLVAKSAALEGSISTKEKFKTYFDQGDTLCSSAVAKCEEILPRLERLGKGWRAIAKDLEFIVSKLSDDGRAQLQAADFNMFVTSLDTAQGAWADVAKKADHFRLVAAPIKANTPEEVMNGATTEAA